MQFFSALIALDEWFFLQLNTLYHTAVLDWFFLFFSFYPLIIWICIGLIVAFVEERKDSTFIFRLIFALIAAGAITSVFLKPIVRRPRPDISYGVKVVIIDEQPAAIPFNNDFAFPSGHAAVAFAGAYVVTRAETQIKHKGHGKKYKKIAAWIFYLIAIVTAFSRIYLGKHYPLDVFVGALIGVFIGKVSWKAVDALISKTRS